MNEYEEPRQIFSVSDLSAQVRATLEANFPLIWLEGEISNLASPASGHIYFSIKDSKAQIRCAMFRMKRRLLDFSPENGMQVLMRANVGLYEARGDFQLIVEHMEEAGDGALRREYEQLKRKLRNDGLFDSATKQTLPKLPKRIAVITSPTGAAVRDIISVMQRRFPAIEIRIYPVPVQGDGAAEKIAAAIKLANKRKDCDVLLIGRGGGSLEDLWAFNEEVVAEAIFASQLPTISAVGHEVDFSIADFVADVRAPTPSAAAEILSPDRNVWQQALAQQQQRLQRSMQNQLQQQSQHLDWLARRVISPEQRIKQGEQSISALKQRLQAVMQETLLSTQNRYTGLHASLMQCTPSHRLNLHQQQHAQLTQRLARAMKQRLEQSNEQLVTIGRALDTVSPLATLSRGYAIVNRKDNGELLRDCAAINKDDLVEAQLGKGKLLCQVKEVETD